MDRALWKAKAIEGRYKGKMVEGFLFRVWDKFYILWGTTNGNPNKIQVDQNTLCQCTGLKDRNGNLIFENDIMKADMWENEIEIFEVGWDQEKAKFGFNSQYDEDRKAIYTITDTPIEIIGNKYDEVK